MMVGRWCDEENVCCDERKECSGTKGSDETRHEPHDLSVTVELGLSHCSKLSGKIDNQTDRVNTRTDELMMMTICLECYR
jgi:hypothetical protein